MTIFLSMFCDLFLWFVLLLRRHSYVEAPRSEVDSAGLPRRRGENGFHTRHDAYRGQVQTIGSSGAGNDECIAGFQFADRNLREAFEH